MTNSIFSPPYIVILCVFFTLYIFVCMRYVDTLARTLFAGVDIHTFWKRGEVDVIG
jgi:hypothetical protein